MRWDDDDDDDDEDDEHNFDVPNSFGGFGRLRRHETTIADFTFERKRNPGS